MTHNSRPTNIGVIGWFLVITGAIQGLSLFRYAVRDIEPTLSTAGMSRSVAVLWGIITGSVAILAGTAILKGFNWGRWLYLCVAPVFGIIGVALYGFAWTYLLAVIVYVVILVSLSMPNSSRFFRRGEGRAPNVGGNSVEKKSALSHLEAGKKSFVKASRRRRSADR